MFVDLLDGWKSGRKEFGIESPATVCALSITTENV